MEGRIVLVKLLCKDTANARIGVFSPCIAFRVAGSPGNSFPFYILFHSLPKIFLSIFGWCNEPHPLRPVSPPLLSEDDLHIARHAMDSSQTTDPLGYYSLWSKSRVCVSYFFLFWDYLEVEEKDDTHYFKIKVNPVLGIKTTWFWTDTHTHTQNEAKIIQGKNIHVIWSIIDGWALYPVFFEKLLGLPNSNINFMGLFFSNRSFDWFMVQ